MGKGETRLPEQSGTKAGLFEAMGARRSTRSYAPGPLSLPEVSGLLYSAQGKTSGKGGRTVPSAGATYPLEVLLLAGEVEGLSAGLYRYHPKGHLLKQLLEGDLREAVCEAALGQRSIALAPAVIAITAVYSRTTGRYGQRGVRYVDMEAGNASQNIHLMAEALGLGTVVIGAFLDKELARILSLGAGESPLLLMPVGRKP
ncbi:MAG: SagB/ThcOx family dehydrogenase [Thermodesulfovibrionales bacterium]|nr:SagB/ThcOx family dehydrogenase [Thermodesulfovibrionales bacterium]